MTSLRLCLIAAIVVLATAVQAGERVPKEWRQRYHEIQESVNNKDQKRFFSFFDKSFEQIDQAGGRTLYADYIRVFPGFFRRHETLRTRLDPTSFRASGSDVVLNYAFRVYGIDRDRTTADYVEIGTDTWRKVNGKYLLVKEVVQSLGPIPTK